MTKLEASVVSAMGRPAPIVRSESLRTFEFVFPDKLTSNVMVARHRLDPTVHIAFTVCSLSSAVVVSLADSHPDELAEALAHIEHAGAGDRSLTSRSYVEMRSIALARELGWVAFQLLSIEEDGPTTGFPEELEIMGRSVKCLWAIPLDEEDLEARKLGLDRLIARLEGLDRDYLSISRK